MMNKIAIYLLYVLILSFMGPGITGPAFGESPAKARQKISQTPAGSQKSAFSANPRSEIVLHSPKNDLISVNFTDMTDEELQEALLEANTRLLRNYFQNRMKAAIQDAARLYRGRDVTFRGFRQT